MSSRLSITATNRDGLPILTVDYDPNQMFLAQGALLLSEKMIEEYNRLLKQEPLLASVNVCVVHIEASVAGSPLVRALFQLYNLLHAKGGALFVAGYPTDYMPSLTSLGLPALPGFMLSEKVEEAVMKAKKKMVGGISG